METLAQRRRRLAAEREAALEEAASRARPNGTNALGHDRATQARLGLEVLQAAFALAASETGVVQHPRWYCLEAGQGGIASHYALQVLGHLPTRPHALVEVLQVLEGGIRAAGGEPPPWPRHIRLRPKCRPGPKVSDGKPSEAEVSRRRALIAAAAEKLRSLLVFLPLVAGE